MQADSKTIPCEQCFEPVPLDTTKNCEWCAQLICLDCQRDHNGQTVCADCKDHHCGVKIWGRQSATK